MLQAKTGKQQEYIEALAKEESCDGYVWADEDGVNYKVDSLYDVYISFDTMEKIVDFLRKENEEIKFPSIFKGTADGDGVVLDLRETPHNEVMALCESLAWVKGHDYGYWYDQYVKHGKIWIVNS